jgi:hypothetical protein
LEPVDRRGDLTTDPFDANPWQEGRCESSWQVRGLMLGDLGYLRVVRLLSFGAARQWLIVTLNTATALTTGGRWT